MGGCANENTTVLLGSRDNGLKIRLKTEYKRGTETGPACPDFNTRFYSSIGRATDS